MNLFENGYDSFKKSILKYNSINYESDDYEYEMKDVIIYFHHSIEVLMKYILSENHEMLIYEDIEAFCNSELGIKKSKKITISFFEAVKRYYVMVNDYNSRDYIYYFKEFNELRNMITHYSLKIADTEAEHLISILIPHVYSIMATKIPDFKSRYLDDKIELSVNSFVSDTWEHNKRIFIELIKKLNKSLKCQEDNSKNPKKISSIYIQKRKDKIYDVCPCCNNVLFNRKGSIIVDGKKVLYYGNCNYCKVDISKQELLMMNYLKNFDRFSNHAEIALIDETESHYHRILSVGEKEDLKNKLSELMGDINFNIQFNDNPNLNRSALTVTIIDDMILRFIEKYYDYNNIFEKTEISVIRSIYKSTDLEHSIQHRLNKVIRNDIYEVLENYEGKIDHLPLNEDGYYIINSLTTKGYLYVKSLIYGYNILNSDADKYINDYTVVTIWGEDCFEICYTIHIDEFI